MKKNLLVLLVLCCSILLFITPLTLAQEGVCDRLMLFESYTVIPNEIVKTVNVVSNSYLIVDAVFVNNTRDVKLTMSFADSAGNIIQEIQTENRATLEYTFSGPDTITITIRPKNINQNGVSLDIRYDTLCPPILNNVE